MSSLKNIPTPTLPPCGLYKTTGVLTLSGVTIEADKLVYFHNHSDEGLAALHLPTANSFNRWRFQEKAYIIKNGRDLNFLQDLKPEGFYRLKEHIHLKDESVLPENALVQLGYTINGEGIIFQPKQIEDQNILAFPQKGIGISQSTYDLLEPLNIQSPTIPKQKHLH